MNPLDVLVICATRVPFYQAWDLMQWYVRAEPKAILHPSVGMWIQFNVGNIVDIALRKKP